MKKNDLVERTFWLHFFVFIMLNSCQSPKNKEASETIPEKRAELVEQTASKDKIDFSLIDNQVKIFVDDSLIFDSEFIHNDDVFIDVTVDIGKHCPNGNETLKINAFNGKEPFIDFDQYWGIRYELVLGGEVVDFVFEHNDDGQLGQVFEKEYSLKEWTE